MPEGGGSVEQALTAGQQVDVQVAVESVVETIGGMFGGNLQVDAGGGGAGGSFQFESLEQLDGLISQWKSKADAILQRGQKIREAIGFIEAPAEDEMSQRQRMRR